MKLGGSLPWRALDRLSDADWHLGEWVQQLGNYDEFIWDRVFPKVAGERGEFWPEPTFRLGLVDALKTLWEAVTCEPPSGACVRERAADKSGGSRE